MGDATPSQQPKKRGRKVSQTGDNQQEEAPQAEKKKQRKVEQKDVVIQEESGKEVIEGPISSSYKPRTENSRKKKCPSKPKTTRNGSQNPIFNESTDRMESPAQITPTCEAPTGRAEFPTTNVPHAASQSSFPTTQASNQIDITTQPYCNPFLATSSLENGPPTQISALQLSSTNPFLVHSPAQPSSNAFLVHSPPQPSFNPFSRAIVKTEPDEYKDLCERLEKELKKIKMELKSSELRWSLCTGTRTNLENECKFARYRILAEELIKYDISRQNENFPESTLDELINIGVGYDSSARNKMKDFLSTPEGELLYASAVSWAKLGDEHRETSISKCLTLNPEVTSRDWHETICQQTFDNRKKAANKKAKNQQKVATATTKTHGFGFIR